MRRLLVIIPPDNPRNKINALLRNLAASLDEARWSVCPLFLDEGYRSGGPESLLESLVAAASDVDAVLWWYAHPADERCIRAISQAGCPVVTYNRDFPGSGAMSVLTDVSGVARTHFQRLWNAGKRRLAVLAVDRPSPSIRDYVQTVETLAREAGDECDFRRIKLPYSPAHRPTAKMLEMISELMDGWPYPDGVLCAEIFSFHAMEAWLALRPHIRVPEDVAIATFDHVPRPNVVRLMGNIHNARHDEQAMIRAAVQMIESRLEGKPTPRLSRIPAVMVEAEVCGFDPAFCATSAHALGPSSP